MVHPGVVVASEKLAVQVLFPFILIEVGLPLPEQDPDQPMKVDVELGAARRATVVPEAYAWLQSAPQSMPAGLEVTVPEPAPALVTVRVFWVVVAEDPTATAAVHVWTTVPLELFAHSTLPLAV